ncbi:hypothetical protein CRE_13400 [Caenorhabditis remanei]|uniref:3'-5' exonuclease domain-containing protein n=1 Tax=Caenorhabditis remanei TaxID=31234 RepID=E3M845_CAERE|nr:hypothetical protein CRE_13400 [Caenorhabditis remanei]
MFDDPTLFTNTILRDLLAALGVHCVLIDSVWWDRSNMEDQPSLLGCDKGSLQPSSPFLKDHVKIVTEMDLLKNETMSDWNAPRLRDDQVWYAAMDAVCLYYLNVGMRVQWRNDQPHCTLLLHSSAVHRHCLPSTVPLHQHFPLSFTVSPFPILTYITYTLHSNKHLYH